MNHQIGNERGCETRASANAGEDLAIGDATLPHRDPSSHKLVRSWIDHGLAGAEKKANSNEEKQRTADVRWNERRQRREYSPPDDAACENTSRSEPVGKIAAECLK